jgi:uncharacterized protein
MSVPADTRLPRVRFMAFPFRMTRDGPAVSTRMEHIREQVMQVIFTSPGERVFRPDFAFGARQHVFEPNAPALHELVQTRLYGALADALAGEVDPRTLKVEVFAPKETPERLVIRISYVIAALQKEESHAFTI